MSKYSYDECRPNCNGKTCKIDFTCPKDRIPMILNQSPRGTKQFLVTIPISEPNFITILQKFAEAGFADPYIANWKGAPHMLLTLLTDRQNPPSLRRTLVNAMYIFEQYKGNNCSLRARFSNSAISYLIKTSQKGYTKNGDHSITQKELGGTLYVQDVEKGPVFVIGVNEGSVQPGVEEEVNVMATRYNFHSHPKEAYVRHNVTKAWPSLTDYLGYLKLGSHTIFHVVATIEGIYVMSFGPEWVGKLSKVKKSFVEKNYDIDHAKRMTPFEYTRKVNRIKYHGSPLYHVIYLPWRNASHTIFSVSYKKDGLSCFPDQQSLDRYRKII